MMGWQSNDGMRFKWHEWPLDEWNGIQMTEWHSNDRMTFKWLNDTWMRFFCRNELVMMGWQWNDGMRFKWHEWPLDEWNGIKMTEWHSNDGMTHEWGFKVQI